MHWRRSPRALLIASTAAPLNNTAAPSRPRDTAIGTIVRQSRAWGRKRRLDREATLVWRTSFEAALSVGGSYAELGQGHTVSGQPWSWGDGGLRPAKQPLVRVVSGPTPFSQNFFRFPCPSPISHTLFALTTLTTMTSNK